MGINTSQSMAAKKAVDDEEAQAQAGDKAAAEGKPKAAASSSKAKAADKITVNIPRGYGPQTVQINGENTVVPAGVDTEVSEDVYAMLKGSGALDRPAGL